MKVILILPPSYPGRKRVSSAAPLSLLYLGSFLKQKGYEVIIIDADINGYQLNDLTQKIIEQKPDLIGINVITPFTGIVLNLAKRIKIKNPNLKIVLGGPHVTATRDELLKISSYIDYLVYGEGEYTLLELCQKIKNHQTNFNQINGLIFRQDNKITTNLPRQLIQDLDSLPYVNLSLIKDFDISNYFLFYSKGKKVMNMLTSRGCPFNCSFCSAHLTHGKMPRFRSVENIIQEIEYNKKKYDIGYVAFKDSTFTMNKAWLKKLCQQMIARKTAVNWVCNARIDTVDEELIKLMSQAGCNAIGFGVESGSQRILNILQKGTQVEKIPLAFRWARKYNILTLAAIMIGNPGETPADLEKTYQLSIKINPYAIGFNCLTAYPGTKIYYDALENGTLSNPQWYLKPKDEQGDYGLLGLWDGKLNLPDFDPEKELNKIVSKYYFRPAYIWMIIKRIFSDFHFLKYAIFFAYNIFKKRVSNV